MKINFSKYQGAGNDFIMIDNRSHIFKNYINQASVISFLCHRRFGIGADGLILINKSNDGDFKMVYFNSDGKEGSMCGNGGRCCAAFAHDLGIIKSKTVFSATDGFHQAQIIAVNKNETIVKLQMCDVSNIIKEEKYFIINTGSPHYVTFTKNVKDMDVFTEGKKIRYSKAFKKEGINVNFAEPLDGHIFVRTYERGVEDETLSCGTGSTATAIAANELHLLKGNTCNLITLGGNLSVYFNKINKTQYTDIWLQGPATCVYKGEISI
ncbi:MAG TPA: diaminopimelate epimerase [Bacteroidales bacterium]|nr:diaminopimelate epimerase [Bacteroidales bacterium]HPS15608.1 diaminopimelate epimerase [Bacteroidales bacterium]